MRPLLLKRLPNIQNLLESLPAKDSGVRYRLEGYLFPATYTIKESTTVESLIDSMLAAMDKNLSSHYAAIKEKELDRK